MTVFDIETDGLLDELTKIHVLSWSNDGGKTVFSVSDYDDMRDVLLNSETLIGHNIIRFDIPAVEKVLGIKVTARLVDTLALSWYLNHDRIKHGLEGYGEDYGVPKPVIKDWNSLTYEEYAHRCTEDVKINSRLWRDLDLKLNKLYQDPTEKDRLIDYLSFKLDCMREQEHLGWKLDVERTQKAYDDIMALKQEKEQQLAEAMPKRILTAVRTKPKVMEKKDGSLSSHGERWVALCAENKMPISANSITVVVGEERGNPNSNDQVKQWLFGLGWQPRTWKFVRDKKTGEERKIEQVRKDGELCESVRELAQCDPAVDLLDGLTVLTHRAGILKSFLDGHKDGYLKAEVAGFTNTLRFRHAKPLVNLPSVDKPYGDVIRGVLTCPDGYTLAGADMTSLEDTTKRHYMKPLDPDYVEEMSREGFDPHLDLAKFAGDVTQQEIDDYNAGKRPDIKSLRKAYKVVNYSATYGVGAAKLARETGKSEKEAKALLDAFWKRNWSIEAIAKKLSVREVSGGMWVKNPVSGFWYSLRSEKDRFSTLNQGTGVYCFDNWVAFCRKQGLQTIGQFHDEIIALVKEGEEQQTKDKMAWAVDKLNDKLKLNVPLGTDVQFGKTYADIH
jgi:DNA polymerase I-like protein with 3'-5' exonuclease and polymerase domains